MNAPGTDPKRLLHRVLMGPVALEALPSWIILLLVLGIATAVGLVWQENVAPQSAALIFLLFVLVDWVCLAQLPRTRRSFGPIVPPLLALSTLRAVLAALIALLGSIWLGLVVMAGLSILAWYGTWIEGMGLQVTHRRLELEKWPAGAPPLHLLHLSDLHLERTGLREEKLAAIIESLQPDLICFSGDLLNLSYNSDPLAIADARELISHWNAPLGVYAVTGSPLVDLPETAKAVLKDHPNLRWLQDEAVSLELGHGSLTLVGLTCTHQPPIDGPKLHNALMSAPPESPVILIYHTPDLALEAATAGVDLQLSGHTHGGQIRLPFYGAVVTSSIYGKRFEMGEYRVPRDGRGPLTLYVSRGIGMEGGVAPRARFLCRPEVILWTLTGRDQRTRPNLAYA